jgi:hypothetical protein
LEVAFRAESGTFELRKYRVRIGDQKNTLGYYQHFKPALWIRIGMYPQSHFGFGRLEISCFEVLDVLF